MADLTDNLVQRYEVIPANQDVGDRFDQDNFYPMDGDYDEYDEDYEDFYEDFLGDDEEYEDFDDDEDAELSIEEDEEVWDSFDDDDYEDDEEGDIEDYEFFSDDDDFSEARGGRWKKRRAKRKAKRKARRQARRAKIKEKRAERKAKRKAIRSLPKGERKEARKQWMKERRAKRKERIQARRNMSPDERKALRRRRMKRFGAGANKVAGYYPPIAMARFARKKWRQRQENMGNNFDGFDDEYSELFGIKRKSKGGEGIFKGLGRLFKTKDTQAGVDRLDARLKRRGEKSKFRKMRSKMRRDARQARKLQGLPPEQQAEVKDIATATPVLQQAVVKVSQGVAPPIDEQIVDKAINVANKVIGKDGTGDKLDKKEVKEAIQTATTPTDPPEKQVADTDKVLDEILDDNNPKGKSGWAGLSTGAKVGIIGGSVVVALVVGYFVYKAVAKGKTAKK